MVYSRQDVYARHLVSDRGYPLWTPEPNMNLPDVYVREGLKIGDVGVVVPEDGSFDVFFNVCLPPTHSLHRETGVPNNFTPIPLSERDIAKFPEAEGAGCIISTSSVARVRNTDASDEDPARRAQPGPLNYEFTLASREGAVLILPEGAERYYLRNERLFLDEAIQHAVDWYTFAEQRLGRIISHDSLYLITGFYKALSWSLAAYQQGAGTGEASAQFKAVQVGRGNIAGSYTWETTQAMDWRVGPSDQYYNGIPNQTMFIQGFKIAVREGILRTKWVNVKADFPSLRPYRVGLSNGSRFSNLWSRISGSSSGSTADAPKGTGTCLNMDAVESNLPDDESDGVREDITIRRFPQAFQSKPFHPSDFINQYLLRKVPSASVAITHDGQWSTLLERGLLKPNEASREDCLVTVISNNYTLASHEGTVYLQSTMMDSAVGSQSLSSTASSTRYSSYHTAESPRESTPPSPTVEPPAPRSATPPAKVPHINTDPLRASNPSQPPSEETSSVRSSLDSICHTSSHSSYTTYSEVHLQSCTEESEDYLSELPFTHSIATVRRRESYATRCGAFADIWECDLISGETSRRVAVKAVKTNTNGYEDLRSHEKKLHRELKVWRRLRHRNIVPLLGVVPGFGPLPSMVSPWFCNGSLSRYLAHHQMLKLPEKHRLLGDIAAGLCYLHSQDVIHGDLHSDNVLIDEHGTACLMDFSLSVTNEFVGTSYLESSICGGVQFADPALIQRVNSSQDNVFYPTKPSDMYSFGGLMLHVLSGRKPYDGIPASVIFLTVLRGERPQIPTHIAPWHKTVIQMCWDHEERKRPSTDDLVRIFDRQ